MKRSLVLGATAVTAANTQAAIVYWDTTGEGMTVSSLIDVDSSENLWIYYDSATQTIGQGGRYGLNARRGFNLQAKGTTGKSPGKGGNYLEVFPAGKSLTGQSVSNIVGKMVGGAVISAGTAIDGSGSIDFDNGIYAPLTRGVTDYYVGIRLWEGNTDGEYNYGWASITTSADGLSATLNGVAFESEINTAINAGATETSAVPEPGNVVSLAVFLSSAAFLRTRRKVVAA